MTELEADMIAVCRQLALLSEVAAANYDRTGSSPADRDNAPRGPAQTLGDVWWEHFQSAPDDGARRRVYHQARAVLAVETRGRHRPLMREDRDRFIIDAYAGEPVEFVALAEGLGYSAIEKVRRAAGVRASDGIRV